MLYAILQQMQSQFPNAQFVMTPTTNNRSAPYKKRAELGLYQKIWFRRFGLQWGKLGEIIPQQLREMYGLVLNKEIDIVLDAAGFSYSSDQGEGRSIIELAKLSKYWKRNGTRIVLLPQAFGPFNTKKSREAIKIVINNVDLIFARDLISYNHLIETVDDSSNIKLAPDFTNLTQGIVPENFDTQKNRFCIVPNYRMIDKTTKVVSDGYIRFMIKCTEYLLEKELNPFILIHEGVNDFMLAQKIVDAVEGNLTIIREGHPLKVKGIIGGCDGIIGSRFHSLVSALSQNVPALGTGWSHKYDMLFEDYGFRDGLMDTRSEDEIQQKIDLISLPETRKEIISTITTNSVRMKENSQLMWDDVFKIINKYKNF